jgi:hypothetical protein
MPPSHVTHCAEKSCPTQKQNASLQGTLRISFVLRFRAPNDAATTQVVFDDEVWSAQTTKVRQILSMDDCRDLDANDFDLGAQARTLHTDPSLDYARYADDPAHSLHRRSW